MREKNTLRFFKVLGSSSRTETGRFNDPPLCSPFFSNLCEQENQSYLLNILVLMNPKLKAQFPIPP